MSELIKLVKFDVPTCARILRESVHTQCIHHDIQGNESYTGVAARDTASALQVLTAAARGVAATTDDRALQMNLIKATQAVVAESAKLIQEAKDAVNNPGDATNQPRLAQVTTDIHKWQAGL